MQELTDDAGSGDAQVDEAVRTLEALEGLPVHEHAPVVERVHQVLQDRLSGEPDAVADEAHGGDGFGDHDAGDHDHGHGDHGHGDHGHGDHGHGDHGHGAVASHGDGEG
ncbi:hypothetical protein [Jiangella alba]|uniref:Uncharacterized protein n=1 Tax=Jiangella alba TaxID=561176 RepID=A0A1H5KJE9_9ACTN|nr:hypothetical protein [Jiangella alba]SEE64118.1 hypothetical protein SAMN04488561_2067 [Jiangella alba]